MCVSKSLGGLPVQPAAFCFSQNVGSPTVSRSLTFHHFFGRNTTNNNNMKLKSPKTTMNSPDRFPAITSPFVYEETYPVRYILCSSQRLQSILSDTLIPLMLYTCTSIVVVLLLLLLLLLCECNPLIRVPVCWGLRSGPACNAILSLEIAS